jgi:hypothetical protein
MDIKGNKVMILGGFGEVGFAICRRYLREEPSELIVTSLRKGEASEAITKLHLEAPTLCKLTPVYGNLFVRWTMKDFTREEILSNPQYQRWLVNDIFGELTEEILTASTLYRVILKHRPKIIVDSINTATALAYQNVYQSYKDISQDLQSPRRIEDLVNKIYSFLSTLSIPPLIRHIQILYEAMRRAGSALYLKVGTTGTGGMGLNIPFTHGEERPSRVLLSKTAVAGAHTLLLLLLSRTPGEPIVKELKPAALIGWKGVGKGRIFKGETPIPLFDCPPEEGFRLIPGVAFRLDEVKKGSVVRGRDLEGVYVDTGENGLFSLDEFKAITSLGLMESITPEEIANSSLLEIRGINTSKDVLGAIEGALMGPTYRAGLLRHRVIKEMEVLGAEGIAYELLGPPRVSKLIFEASLIKRGFGTVEEALQPTPEEMSRSLRNIVQIDQQLRTAAISVGIPFLLPDGEILLFASRRFRDKGWERGSWQVTPENIEKWAYQEWIDLRPKNMSQWQKRLEIILKEARECLADTSSCFDRGGHFWQRDDEDRIIIDPGEFVGFVLIKEEGGGRSSLHSN